jgi:hypothetical protein
MLLHPTGILVCLDGFMNVALEQAEEFVDGALTQRLGDAFIRGNNGAAARGAGIARACRQGRHTPRIPSHPVAVLFIAPQARRK